MVCLYHRPAFKSPFSRDYQLRGSVIVSYENHVKTRGWQLGDSLRTHASRVCVNGVAGRVGSCLVFTLPCLSVWGCETKYHATKSHQSDTQNKISPTKWQLGQNLGGLIPGHELAVLLKSSMRKKYLTNSYFVSRITLFMKMIRIICFIKWRVKTYNCMFWPLCT